MGIKPNFTDADIRARFDHILAKIEQKQIEALFRLGEMCVIHARDLNVGNYTDQTTDLRNSIGYTVFKNGVAIHENYKNDAGRELANKAAETHPEGLVLVVVAGMNYALHVEATGRNVLTATEIYAEQLLPELLEKLKKSLSKV